MLALRGPAVLQALGGIVEMQCRDPTQRCSERLLRTGYWAPEAASAALPWEAPGGHTARTR